MNESRWEPLEFKCIVKPKEIKETSDSGKIYLAAQTIDTDKYKQEEGELIAIGSKAFCDWPVKPEVGDTVTFDRYAGSLKNLDGQDYRFLNDTEIVAREIT